MNAGPASLGTKCRSRGNPTIVMWRLSYGSLRHERVPTIAVSSFHGLTGWVDEARTAMTQAPMCFQGFVGPGRHAKFNPHMKR